MRIDVPITDKKVNKNYQIVIPKIIRGAMELKPGDIIEWSDIEVKQGEVSCKIRVIPKRKQETLEV